MERRNQSFASRPGRTRSRSSMATCLDSSGDSKHCSRNTRTKEVIVKTYKNHRCKRRHKSEGTFLRCAFPTLAWVQGEGAYAVIAWCRTPTITLWSSTNLAQAALTELDALRCGGRCTGRHEIVHLNIGGTT